METVFNRLTGTDGFKTNLVAFIGLSLVIVLTVSFTVLALSQGISNF